MKRSHRATLVLPIAIILFPTAAWTALTENCLTGTAPDVVNDVTQIKAVRTLIDGACPCANFDGSRGKTHASYVACAMSVIASQIPTNLRLRCRQTARAYYSQSTCGKNPLLHTQPCIQVSLRTGRIKCAIRATTRTNGTLAPNGCLTTTSVSRVACPAYTQCIEAADSNGDLIIAAPGDNGMCVPTATATPTVAVTSTPSHTPTATFTPVNTATPSNTPVNTAIPTATPSNTPLNTATPSNTPVNTHTVTHTVPTAKPTNTNTPVPPTSTDTPTTTSTSTPTNTPTVTATATPSGTPTNTWAPINLSCAAYATTGSYTTVAVPAQAGSVQMTIQGAAGGAGESGGAGGNGHQVTSQYTITPAQVPNLYVAVGCPGKDAVSSGSGVAGGWGAGQGGYGAWGGAGNGGSGGGSSAVCTSNPCDATHVVVVGGAGGAGGGFGNCAGASAGAGGAAGNGATAVSPGRNGGSSNNGTVAGGAGGSNGSWSPNGGAASDGLAGGGGGGGGGGAGYVGGAKGGTAATCFNGGGGGGGGTSYVGSLSGIINTSATLATASTNDGSVSIVFVPAATATPTSTGTFTPTPTLTNTSTMSPTATTTSTNTPTPTLAVGPSLTPTNTVPATLTATQTPTSTATSTPTTTATPTSTFTTLPTVTATATPVPTALGTLSFLVVTGPGGSDTSPGCPTEPSSGSLLKTDGGPTGGIPGTICNGTKGHFASFPGSTPMQLVGGIPDASGVASLTIAAAVVIGSDLPTTTPSCGSSCEVCWRIEQDATTGFVDCNGGSNADVSVTINSNGSSTPPAPSNSSYVLGSTDSGAGAAVIHALIKRLRVNGSSVCPLPGAAAWNTPDNTVSVLMVTGTAVSRIDNPHVCSGNNFGTACPNENPFQVSLVGTNFSCANWTAQTGKKLVVPFQNLEEAIGSPFSNGDIAQVLRLAN